MTETDRQEEQATNRFLQSIRLRNLLSFGPDGEEIELQPLNVLIGPNASGKSNFIEAISLLKAAPVDLQAAIREGGGVQDWLWKGTDDIPTAELEALLNCLNDAMPARYRLGFTMVGQRMEVTRERIERKHVSSQEDVLYDSEGTTGQQSILQRIAGEPGVHYVQRYFPKANYISRLRMALQEIRIFREWRFGPRCLPRKPEQPDMPESFLLEDFSNLGLVLNDLEHHAGRMATVLANLRKLFDGLENVTTRIRGGTVQIYLHERGGRIIPATRLSDGTLRYLCLLVILCHPEPPPLICIEEPELGLHPDVIGTIAELLVEASKRTQLIVTTHSEILVSALSETPESILVCEQDAGGTTMRRLEPEKLKEWLREYSLGDLWAMGEIGGGRW